ncbi:hypothetical protein [Pedobacter psychroterrae]|uniref:Uncharacterized protein n=1 Tax=Pedobacter psychroterrae TaxID=2530453 RepID=A0A4R0NMZ8_9SPHI|nr:hypothetical protein [Pedobacter psychroterrae]TCD01609.1 hypothetical protein EZ437_12885 [Pedobacter psychroterrae]
MLSTYLNIQFDIEGKPVNGFCMQIHDDFHETYAVILDGYHSFCVWLDGSSTWHFSKNASIEPSILDQIISKLTLSKSEE